MLPALDSDQLNILQTVGREWGQAVDDRDAWRRALPVDPELDVERWPEEPRPTRFGRFVPVASDGRA
jgi:hypothetical protein